LGLVQTFPRFAAVVVSAIMLFVLLEMALH
jgi:hypothetical protein